MEKKPQNVPCAASPPAPPSSPFAAVFVKLKVGPVRVDEPPNNPPVPDEDPPNIPVVGPDEDPPNENVGFAVAAKESEEELSVAFAASPAILNNGALDPDSDGALAVTDVPN